MKIVKNAFEMTRISEQKIKDGFKIGFVPTMGALHKGHRALIREARKISDFIVVSIFVNPLQFGPNEDYREYPRTTTEDLKICEEEKVNCVFVPEVEDMYDEDFCTFVEVEGITDTLCGLFREGHFKGVTTVVAKLFNIVKPHIAVFGWKDAQQLLVIKRMVKDLNIGVEIVGVETVREEDGLAMSSRNIYLNEEERKSAKYIYQSLLFAKELILKEKITDPFIIKERAENFLKEKAPLCKIQYFEIVSINSLKPVKEIKGEILIAVACFLGKARLIDNVRINV